MHKPRKNTAAVVGVEFGDEGKGRLIDNKIQDFLSKKDVNKVYVIRFAGGSNAGHTIQSGNVKLGLHQLPSSVMQANTIGVMDRGMVIHPEDVISEILFVEDVFGKVRSKLIISSDAILCTDLERAEEVLNRLKSGKAKGGTGRGISPSYAHHYDRLGLHIYDLMSSKWKNLLSTRYDLYRKEFNQFNLNIAQVDVPDFYKTKKRNTPIIRKVGSKRKFMERLEKTRKEIIKRDLVKDTYELHKIIDGDTTAAILFEGAQGLGIHPWLGKRPDVTSSDTSVYGVASSTAYWRQEDINERYGVFKATYTSCVGALIPPTKTENNWSKWVREAAHEYGTTTKRPRDILYLDMSFLAYNCRMAGINSLVATHLDIARKGENIKVCTHYSKKGKKINYQPNLRYLENAKPVYISLPGWDGGEVAKVKKAKDLPKNSLKFLQFVEKEVGLPIKITTTGPSRENIIHFK